MRVDGCAIIRNFHALNALDMESESGSESEGYVTPNEFVSADDERPPSPPKQVSPNNSIPVVVSADLQQRIINQVEWYFSDENLMKDSFLMKHIHRNKQGLVSLKLVASFRKVKSLTKDCRVVQTCLLHSNLLELNDERTKVRRLAPVPEVDYSHALRTVIILNYPDPQPQTEDIEREFSKYGEVTLVRILHPGMAIPLDVKPSRKRHPAIGNSLCILVEFESQEGAKKACRRFNSQQSWRDQLSVSLLSKKEGDEEPVKMKKSEEGHFLSPVKPQAHRNARDTSPVKTGHRRKHKGSPIANRKFLSPQSNRDTEYLSDSGLSRGRSPRLSPEPIRKFPSDQTLMQSSRKNAGQESRLIRQPWGPDGTRGFVRNVVNLPTVSIIC